MAKRIKLIAVDSTVAYGQAIPDDVLEAWTLTATFAQAAARAAVKGQTSGGTDTSGGQAGVAPDDIVSDAYFNALTTQFNRLGWLITTSGLVKYGAPAKQVEPRQIVLDVLSQYIQPDEETVIEDILDTLQDQAEPDQEVSDFLNFWWQNAEAGEDRFHFGMGPLRMADGQPVITLVYFSFTYTRGAEGKGWRRLFRAAEVQVQARYLAMRLNMDGYAQHRDQLKARLGEKAAAHIATADLDL